MLKKNLTSDEKIMAALSYFWILFLLPLLLKKNNPFCQHHAKQGLVLFIFSLVISVLGGIPILGWLIIMPLGWIAVVLLALMGIVNALQGKLWLMPFLGKYTNKIHL
ncbi:MAG TPA: hypothetical protein PLK76_04325 [bacterium]|nr:hypothetical protein [bacterium]